jgi:hypothetical protein
MIVHGDRGTGGGELLGAGIAEAGTRAGDDRDLPIETAFHDGNPLLGCCGRLVRPAAPQEAAALM